MTRERIPEADPSPEIPSVVSSLCGGDDQFGLVVFSGGICLISVVHIAKPQYRFELLDIVRTRSDL